MAGGVAKKLVIAKETSFGVPALSTGGKSLRRNTSDFNLIKDTYNSSETRTDYQASSARHGAQRVDGALAVDLSPGNFSELFGSLLARDMAAQGSITGLTLDITISGNDYVITRDTGTWSGDYMLVGNVIRLSGANLDANNINKNLVVIALSGSDITVRVLNGTGLTPETGAAASTVSYPGKSTFVETSGHTDDSYTVEEYFSDVDLSNTYVGNKVTGASVSLPTTGMSTVNFTFLGKGQERVGLSGAYFTSPTAALTTAATVATSGVLLVNGQAAGCVTSASVEIQREAEAKPCVGSNTPNSIIVGPITANGSLEVSLNNNFWQDKFVNETPVSLLLILADSNADDADFLSIILPGTKLNSFTKSDNPLDITSSVDFTTSPDDVQLGLGLPVTTIFMQDSAAV